MWTSTTWLSRSARCVLVGAVEVRRQQGHINALFHQVLGFPLAGLAVDLALRHLAIMNLARFLGEAGPDVIGILLHIFAQAHRKLARLFGVRFAHSLLGARDGRRHHRFFDLRGVARRACEMAAARLLVERSAVAKPAFEFVPLMAT